MIGASIATLLVTWLVWYLERREKRIKANNDEHIDVEERTIDEKKSQDGHEPTNH